MSWTFAPYEGGQFGIGWVFCEGDAICRVLLPDRALKAETLRGEFERYPGEHGGAALRMARRVEAYFCNGDDLSGLPIHLPKGLRPFQRRVLEACRAIPRGEVRRYRDLADAAGSPRAFRAVGNVMSTNPLPLIIPCHRVLASDGIGNYGGGADMKKWLLEREGAPLP